MKRILLLFSALMLSITALWAHDVEIDGIYYNLDETNKTAEVTFRGSSALDYSNEYIASYKIPSFITFESEEYIVTSIGDSAFYNCRELTSVNMPNTITSIGKDAFYQCNNLQHSSYISNDEDIDIPTVPIPKEDETTLLFQIENTNCDECELYLMGIGDIWYDQYEMLLSRIKGTRNWYYITVPALDESQTNFQIRANGDWLYRSKSGYIFLEGTDSYVKADDDDINSLMMIKAAGGKVLAFKVIEFVTPCAETATYTITLKTTYCGDEGTDVGIIGDFPASNWSETIPMKKHNDNTYTYTIENGIPGMQFTFQSTTGNWSNRPIAWEVNAETGEEGWNKGIPNNKLGEETNIVIDLTDSKYSWSACISETRSAVVNEEESNTEKIDYFIIPSSVKSIGKYAFYGCTSLKKVNYLGTIEEWVEINFENSSSNPTSMVKDLYINNELITDVKIISADSIKQYAFYNCESIKSIEIGNSVTSIGSQAFYDCDGLKKVNYLGTIDEWVEIDFIKYQSNPTEYAKDLYINNELVTDVKITYADSIKQLAFIYCKSIKTLEIGNSVNSIGEYAFSNCESLKSLSIGENLNQIGDYAFANCINLKSVTINAKQVPSYNYFTDLFGTYIAYLNVPCEALEAYELDNAFGQFKYIRCIEEEEEAPEDVEIEVDDNGNVNIKWPPTEGANSYKLLVSQGGEVFCTLLFNSMGQLTSIDLGNRSASVGFQFTVTGLTEGSKYGYEMTALSEDNEVLDYYAGAFITNGYNEDDDVTTSINESITDANITVSGGKISADADFSIYNTIGQDVTAFNGSLQPGVYLVSIENNIVKVMVK